MKLTEKQKSQRLAYQAGTSFDNLGDLHERARCVRMLAQKHHGQIPSELYQAIFDLELEASFYNPANPPYGSREI
jgi:hypothetical protein